MAVKKPDLPTVVAIISILGFLIAMWSKFGWETPDAHDEDIHDTTEAILEFQTRWICDEDQESLDELLEKPTRTAKELQQTLQLADAIDENDCRKF